jgi:hypothetical protein
MSVWLLKRANDPRSIDVFWFEFHNKSDDFSENAAVNIEWLMIVQERNKGFNWPPATTTSLDVYWM